MDIAALRAETPGCEHVLHFNNAGAALPPRAVVDTQTRYLKREATIGGYEAAHEAAGRIEHTYSAIARMLGCDSDEVALVESATRAWDMAFYSMDFEEGDVIVTSRASYASNYIAFLQVARRTGVEIRVAPSEASGEVDIDQLREIVAQNNVALLALTHVPTNGGLVNPVTAAGAIANEAGVPFLLDACQSAGQMPLRVRRIGCTMLSATGRKYLRGPRGTGFLYVRRDWIERLEPPLLDLHAATWTEPDAYQIRQDARRFEAFEGYVAGKIALGVAIDYAMTQGLVYIEERVQALADRLRDRIARLPGVRVYDTGRVQCGITTFATPAMEATAIQEALRARDINVSVSTPSSTRHDAATRTLPPLVRASVHYYNTDDEVDRFVAAVRDVIGA
jgi:selenocysteine lyase/cysteine desulfurase